MYWPLESLLVEWDSSPLRLRRLVRCPIEMDDLAAASQVPAHGAR